MPGRFLRAVVIGVVFGVATQVGAQEGAGSAGFGAGFGGASTAAPAGAAAAGTAGVPGATSAPQAAPAPTTIPSITNAPADAREAAERARSEERRDAQAPTQLDPNQRNEFQDFVSQSLGRPLPMFGYSLFSGVPSTFAPVDRIPVTPDYLLGPGDEVVIRAWGQVDIDYRAVIDRNGAINIPRVGNINLSGIRYQELEGFLRTAIGRVFRNFELNATMGQLRSIQIFVVGQARRPGSYTVSSLSTLVNALFASGGPTPRGSMRAIQLRRADKVVTEFDLYDLLLRGDKSKDVRLLPGDVIHIPPVGQLVAVSGSVNEPAIYELKGNATLAGLIELSGGFTTTAAGQKAKVERIAERRLRSVEEFTLDAAGMKRTLRDGDLVQIYAISPKFDNAITLRGSVAEPGRYPWREGLRVRDVLPSRDALINPEFWLRQNAASRIQPSGQARLRTEVRRSFEEINWEYAVVERLNYDDLSTQLIPFHLGRAVIDGDPSHNIVLRPGDVVTIFSKDDIAVPTARQTKYVRLEGEFASPGVYQVQPGETLRQLVARVGGVSPNAYLYGAEFTRESTRQFQQRRLDESIDQMEREIQRQAAAGALGALSQQEAETLKVQADSQRQLVARLRAMRASGRIVLELPAQQAQLRDLPDLTLEDGDRFAIPAAPAVVGVVGSVYNQNAFIYRPNQRLADYLARAGGPTKDADPASIYVVKADGSVISRRQSGWLPIGQQIDNLMPGDTIVVPEKLDRYRLTKELRDWSQVFYQFALGVVGLKVLKDL